MSLKLTVYYNILAAFQAINEPVFAMDVMKCKVTVLLPLFVRLNEIENEDHDSAGIVLYSKLPSHDVRPLMREIAYFFALLQAFSNFANLPDSEEQLKHFMPNFISSVNRLAPLVEQEANYLNAIYVQLDDEIRKDKAIKKILLMS